MIAILQCVLSVRTITFDTWKPIFGAARTLSLRVGSLWWVVGKALSAKRIAVHAVIKPLPVCKRTQLERSFGTFLVLATVTLQLLWHACRSVVHLCGRVIHPWAR